MDVIEISVNEEDARGLEAASYEVQARKQVLALCIDQGMDIQSEAFRRYQREYVACLAEWEQAKAGFEHRYLSQIPDRRRWVLDHRTRTVSVTLG